jgi:radical SAM superfamily enzyme YgiQ (UPF0313 family)
VRVDLISPRPPVDGATRREKALLFSRLGLATVAAQFPEDTEVRIINDSLEPIDFDSKVDLVGVTAITSTAPRAYMIADRFRAQGVPVVLGGMHPSAMPQEASTHSDAVVIGEAEGVMRDVVSDFKTGKLKKFYQATERPSLADLPLPRRNLLNGSRTFPDWDMVQTTRGCPFKCDFCSVSDFFGQTYRTRPIPDVIREIKQLRKHTTVFFVDDNIAGRPNYARKLFKALVPLKIKWFGQGSVLIAKDMELLRLARKSGCFGLFIGFETLSSQNLKEVGKTTNHVRNYSTAIKKIHDNGIGIVGAFIFGLDSDDSGVFEKTVDFINRNQLELASFSILTPLPGTRLYGQMLKQNRIIDSDWSKYTCGEVVFRPNRLTVDELQGGYYWARKQISSYNSILRRTLRPRKTAILSLPINIGMRKTSRGFLKRISAH